MAKARCELSCDSGGRSRDETRETSACCMLLQYVKGSLVQSIPNCTSINFIGEESEGAQCAAQSPNPAIAISDA